MKSLGSRPGTDVGMRLGPKVWINYANAEMSTAATGTGNKNGVEYEYDSRSAHN